MSDNIRSGNPSGQRPPSKEEVFDYADRLLDKGMPPKQVAQRLVERIGLPPEKAVKVVKSLLAQPREEEADEEDIYDYADKLYSRGMKPKQIKAKLIDEEGLSEKEARQVLKEILPAEKKPRKSGSQTSFNGGGLAMMAVGAFLVLLGIGITMASMSSSGPGGRYYIVYGPVIFGAITFFKGLASMFS